MIAERRHYPRIHERLQGQIVFDDGAATVVAILNISRGGVQLECSSLTARKVSPPPRTQKNKPVEVHLGVGLVARDQSEAPFEASCRVVVLRRISETRYHLGLQFVGIDKQYLPALEAFIAARVASNRPSMLQPQHDASDG